MDDREFELVTTSFQAETRLDLFGLAGYQLTEIREDRVPTRKTLYATAFSPHELDDEGSLVKLCSKAMSRGVCFFRREVIDPGYASADKINHLTIRSDVDSFRFEMNSDLSWKVPCNEAVGEAQERREALEELVQVEGVKPVSDTEELAVQDHFEVQLDAKKDARFSPGKAGGRWMGKSEYHADTLDREYPLPLPDDEK